MNVMSGNRAKVYQVLRRAALDNAPCPTNAEIADRTGISCAGTVSSALHTLKEHGLLALEPMLQARDVVFPDGARTNGRQSWEATRTACAEAFGFETWQIITRSRRRPVVRARMACAWVLRKRFVQLSLPAIGRVLGGRDHSTIKHLVDMAEVYRARDPQYRALTDALRHGEPTVRAVPLPANVPAMIQQAEAPASVWCDQCESRVIAPCSWARCGQRERA